MSDSSILSSVILAKVEEQIERADHLLTLVPADKLEWRPTRDAMRVCDLLGHLLESAAGFCAALYALDQERLAHLAELRRLPVNHCCGAEEARARLRDYLLRIKEGFEGLSEEGLARRLPTVFAQEGEPALAILMGNLEHLINHKYQLFFYLKMLGVPVGTGDLYRLRGM